MRNFSISIFDLEHHDTWWRFSFLELKFLYYKISLFSISRTGKYYCCYYNTETKPKWSARVLNKQILKGKDL